MGLWLDMASSACHTVNTSAIVNVVERSGVKTRRFGGKYHVHYSGPMYQEVKNKI